MRRILTLVVFLAAVSGTAWFFLRDTPAKKVTRLRTRIEALAFSQNAQDWNLVTTEAERAKGLNSLEYRLDLARKTSDELLAEPLRSKHDLVSRGAIEEMDQKWRVALWWYARTSEVKKPPSVIYLRMARIYRLLGMASAAKGAYASVVEEYPFDAYMGIGRSALDIFDWRNAYSSFLHARLTVSDDPVRWRESTEAVVEALDVAVSSLKEAVAKQPSPDLETQLATRSQERDGLIDELVGLLKEVEPESRVHFVRLNEKVVDLLTRKTTPNIEGALAHLETALEGDIEKRNVPLYVVKGNLCTRLSTMASIPEIERLEYWRKAESCYQEAQEFHATGAVREVAEATGWVISLPNVTVDEFAAAVLLKTCQSLVKAGHSWRLPLEASPNGEKDRLQIAATMDRLLSSPDVHLGTRLDLRMWRALAILREGDSKQFFLAIDSIMADALTADRRRRKALSLAEACVSVVPNDVEVLLAVVDGYLKPDDLVDVESLAEDVGTPEQAKKVSDSARNLMRVLKVYRRSIAAQLRVPESEAHVEQLTDRVKDILIQDAERATAPRAYPYITDLMSTIVGSDDARELLKRGRERFPDDRWIRVSLALAYLQEARSLDRDARAAGETTITEDVAAAFELALNELVPLLVGTPHNFDLLSRVRIVAARFKNEPERFGEMLHTVIRGVFPNSSPDELAQASGVLGAYLQRDFVAVTDAWKSMNDLGPSKPFIALLAGLAYLEQADGVLRMLRSINVEVSGQVDAASIRDRIRDLTGKADDCFAAGLTADPDHISLKVQRLRSRLNVVSVDEPSPESTGDNPLDPVIREIRDVVAENQRNAEAQYLLAMALNRKWNWQLASGVRAKFVYPVMVEERSCLRKAIVAAPRLIDAYLQLSESYVVGWRQSDVVDRGTFADPSRRLFAPDFAKAITVLKSAPSSPEVLERIGQYYEADGDLDEARSFQQLLLRSHPVEANLNRLLRTLVKLKRFDEARTLLKSLEADKIIAADFETTQLTGLALVAAEEIRAIPKTDFEKQELRQFQVGCYRRILARAEEKGFSAPAYVLNNLAYLLIEYGTKANIDEAIRLLESALERVGDGKDRMLSMGSVADIRETYAWALYLHGDLQRSHELYKELAEAGNDLGAEFYYHFAKLLFDLREFESAAQQLSKVLEDDVPGADALVSARARKLNVRIEIELQRLFEREAEFIR